MLYVRATLQDLDIIEAAIQVLNSAPPQITISSKFVEFNQEDTKAIGFQWWLGNTLMNNGAIGAQAGTAPSFFGAPSAANPIGVFPGVPGFDSSGNPLFVPPATTDQLLTSGLRNNASAPVIGTLTGILTDPQFRVAIQAIEQRGGSDTLADNKVITQSGRQTQIKTVEIKTYVSDLSLAQTAGGTGGATATAAGTATSGQGAVGSQVQPLTAQIEVGPTLDVVPYVSADGYTVQMTIIPTTKEFLGYDDPGPFIAQIQGAAGNTAPVLSVPTPLPKFRLRQ